MLSEIRKKLTGGINAAVRRHLDWMHRLTGERPLLVLLAALLLLLLSAATLRTVRFESDIFRLFPTEQGALRLFLDSLEWTGSAQDAYFLLEGEKGKLTSEAESFAERLRALRVDGEPAFSKVTCRVFDKAEARAFADFAGYAVSRPQVFLDPAEVPRFLAALTPRAMDRALQRAGTELASQAGSSAAPLIAVDPLYLRDLVLPRLKRGSQALDLDPTSPYFLSRDGRVLIIIAKPSRPVQDMAFARKLVAGINRARVGAGVSISCTGAHLSAVIDEAVMKRNIVACILSSLLVVLALFYLTYRRFLPTILLPGIIFCGVVPALGSAGLFLSSIHIISFAFMALIIGLGTDYSIHIYDRFYSERAAGVPFDEALRLASVHTGHGVFTSGMTTALPFLALTLSDVRALFELGLLVGLGVVFTMYATFFFLPPLLHFTERRLPASAYKTLPGFGLGALWRFARNRAGAVRRGTLLLVVCALVLACFVSFEGDLKNLQPRQSEALLAQEKIERHLSITPKQMLLAVEGKGLEDVLARGSRVALLLERTRQKGEIAAYSALEGIVNGRGVQAEIEALLAEGLAGTDPGRELRLALERNGFAAEPFQSAIDGISALHAGREVPPLEAIERLAASPLRGVVERHLLKNGGSFHLLFYLHYQGEEFNQQAFLRELAAIDPAARATSVDLVSAQLAESVKRSFVKGFILGGVLVLLLLLAHFETLAGVLYSLCPVFAGVIAMLGLMVATGMGLNFMNAMVLVTILGMGSDYGLHIGHRTAAVPPELQQAEFVQAGRAVFLSALTTIAGFGSLAFADYGALASIGWATNYGIGATLFFTLVSLPAFIRSGGKTSEI
jgi:predicted RND superfamily exporter protein